MGVNNRNMYSWLQKYNKLNKSHLVGQLLNSIKFVKKNLQRKRVDFPCMSWNTQELLQLHNGHKILYPYFAEVLLCQHLTTHQFKINNCYMNCQ